MNRAETATIRNHFYSAILSFGVSIALIPSAQADACSELKSELSSISESLAIGFTSLKSLLEVSESAGAPLNSIFQVDLKNPTGISHRKSELSNLLSEEGVRKSREFSRFLPCLNDETVSQIFSAVVLRQTEVNKLKVNFLEKPEKERVELIAAYDANRSRSTTATQIGDRLTESQTSLEEAQKLLIRNEKDSAASKTEEGQRVYSLRANLEKYLVDLESEHIQFVENISAKRTALDELRKSLNEASKSSQSGEGAVIAATLEQVSAVWGASVDSLFDLFKNIDIGISVPKPDESGEAILEEPKYKSEAQAYRMRKAEITQRQERIIEERSQLLTGAKVQDFKLLSDTGVLRSNLFHRCKANSACPKAAFLSERNLRNVLREIQVLPLRAQIWGVSKWVELRGQTAAGFDGWIHISKQVFYLLLFAMIPFGMLRFFAWLSKGFERLRTQILSRSMIDFRKRTLLAVWIARLNPFLESVGMVVAVALMQSVLRGTDLSEISIALFYVQLYFVYQGVRMLLKVGLEAVFSIGVIDEMRDQRERIERTSTRLSKLFFGQYAVLRLIEDTVQKALVYDILSNIVFWISTAVMILEIRNWRREIIDAFKTRFERLAQGLAQISRSPLSAVLLPILLFLVIGHDILVFFAKHLVRLDLVKRLLSDVLKKRLERTAEAAKSTQSPDQNYLNYFDYYRSASGGIFVEQTHCAVSEVSKLIVGWQDDTTRDDLVVIVGNRGMGKTTTLERIFQETQSPGKKMAWIKPKTTQVEQLYELVSSLSETKIRNLDDFLAYDATLDSERIFFMDDLQNLFLAQIGGFGAYREFVELISLKTKNVFWCLSVNSRSWAYLQGVFGKEQFYGKIIPIRPWSDAEIQRLILARHEMSGYSRTFDESVKAYGAGDALGQQTEVQFFRLLWGQSRGNPRSALMYWVSAISAPSPKTIYVGVPSFVNSAAVGSMSDDALFLLAAITRHDSLTHQELHATTEIDESVIRKCMKEAHDKGLVWSDDHDRIRISSRAQYVIDYYLMGKNFLYE